jgi:hypothetical protein
MKKGLRKNDRAGMMARNLDAYFKEYAECGRCTVACERIGLHKDSYKNWINRVPDYQERMDKAHAEFMANFPRKAETTLVDRAFNGVKEVIRDARSGKARFDRVDAEDNIVDDDYEGPTKKRVAERIVYFPQDLVLINKAYNPEKFGDQQKVVTDGAIRVEVVYRTETPNADDSDPSSPAARRAAACN